MIDFFLIFKSKYIFFCLYLKKLNTLNKKNVSFFFHMKIKKNYFNVHKK